MELTSVLTIAGNVIQGVQVLLAVWGAYAVIFTLRQIKRRRFSSDSETESFLDTLRSYLEESNYDAAVRLCDEPRNVYRAIPMLARVAIVKRHLSSARLRQAIASRFQRDVLGVMDNQRSTINTIAKSEPMLGLLGTVAGMIAAFARIGGSDKVSTAGLASDISLALTATAVGLLVAIPLILCLNVIEVRMRSLEDTTLEGVQIVLEDLDAVAVS